MTSGGKRPGAGRKPGSLNRRPQRGSKLEQQIDQYKTTVLGVVPFQGDSLALLQGVYRGTYTATHDQIYAARPPKAKYHLNFRILASSGDS